MKRNIVIIDEAKCNGCGLCVNACHEGALQMVNGKAKLVSDSYCDGLGDCLPECPTGAITIEEREAEAFDAEAVKQHMANTADSMEHQFSGCPGSRARVMNKNISMATPVIAEPISSQLRQWPCQIKLVPVNAPYFDNSNLLIAADCTAFAYANIHQDFMSNKITLIGCPKLDAVNYSEKLAEIIKRNNLKSITVLRMQVPCCGGMVYAVQKALLDSGKMIPWQVVTISPEGEIVEN